MTNYLISADHVCSDLALVEHPVAVHEYTQQHGNPSLYYATSRGLGCGKNFRTERAAILGLVLDHAYTNVRITTV